MGQLDEKVAIITGAGTGIGKGIARAFAREGADLVIASRRLDVLENAASELRPLGATVEVIATDVTDEAQVGVLFDKCMRTHGRLDILVNNAGIWEDGPLEELSLETWQHIMNVNLTGVFLCSREAVKIMKRQRTGRIINIGSISAQVPGTNSAAYTTSKHGLVGLTKSTALEGREYGVAASCLHPGSVATERNVSSDTTKDQESMVTTDDIAKVAVTMAALPANVNMLESIVLPVDQPYLGRG